jgi:hypothetical protein
MAGFMADDAGGQPGAAGAGRSGRGDAARAVTDLFRDHHLELVRLAMVMVGDLATAEDVVQDAFERLHRGWRGLRQPSSSLAYVRSSVLNGCRSVHRRAAVARKHVPELVVELSAATGKLLKVLYTTTGHDVLAGPGGYPGCSVVSLGPTGVQPLVACSPAAAGSRSANR